MSRLQAGALIVQARSVGLDEVVGSAHRGAARRRRSHRGRRARRPAAGRRRPGAARARDRQPRRQRARGSRRRANRCASRPAPSTAASTSAIIDRGPGIPAAERETRVPARSSGSATTPTAPASASGSRSPGASSTRWAASSSVEDTPGGGTTVILSLPEATRVTQLLVIDDEARFAARSRSASGRTATRSTPRPPARRGSSVGRAHAPRRRRPRPRPAGHGRPRRPPRAARRGRRCRSSCCRRATTSRRRSTRSTPAPTTTSRSRSAWTSSSPASGRRCAAPMPGQDEPVDRDGRLHASTSAPSGPRTRPATTCTSRRRSGASSRCSCATGASS